MIITLLRKPLEGSVADNALKHGCGAINIDATRISTSDNLNGGAYAENPTERGGQDMWTSTRKGDSNCFRRGGAGDYEQPTGRWPANFILTHLEGCISQDEDWACVEGCPVKEIDHQSGHLKSGEMKAGNYQMWGKNGIYGEGKEHSATYYGDERGASRFFKQFQKEGNQ